MSVSMIGRAGADIWKMLSQIDTLANDPDPSTDRELCPDTEVAIKVQVNGKFRGTVVVEANLDDETVISNVLADERIARFLSNQPGEIRKATVVKNEMVDLTVK